jgi:hypothetical protein
MKPGMRHLFYLHGFASSPRSGKASFLARRLADRGQTLHCPDLNEPDFSTLTVTRMLGQVEKQIQGLPPGPVALIGSSLGGFVALHAAARQALGHMPPGATHPIDRLILLAPALEFAFNRDRHLGEPGVARWRETDRLDVFHHGYGGMRPIRFALYEDARRYDALAVRIETPILIFQGLRDDAVDPAAVERFACSRPNVTLHLLDDDHQLLGSLDRIWQGIAEFLGLEPAARSPKPEV